LGSLAEAGRTPFDIYTAESELVGGPFVEYSGAHWATFFLAEYMNTFFISALTVLLFFGGWSWPSFGSLLGDSAPAWVVNVLGVAWFMAAVRRLAGALPSLSVDLHPASWLPEASTPSSFPASPPCRAIKSSRKS